jgi:hypothetical protein
MNIIEPIVQGYMFNEIINHTEDTPPKKGGLPVNHIIDSMQFITQKGGGAVRETLHFDQLESYGIPIGLVHTAGAKDTSIQFAGEFNEINAHVISDTMFDNLVGLVTPPSKSKTRKFKPESNRKTIKA